MGERAFAWGAALGGLAVLVGAFAAHGLKDAWSAPRLAWMDTGVRWQAVHALALLATGLAARAFGPSKAFRVAAVAFVVGTVLFSGSLYALAATEVRGLGAVTPFGGVALVVGWGALMVAVRPRRARAS